MRITFPLLFCISLNTIAQDYALEEVTVTAQKREQSIQNVPISIAVLEKSDFAIMNIHGLGDLNGLIPSLSIQPSGNANTTLTMAIRGHSTDPGQVSRETSVGVYIDGVYMSRPQGMGVDLADPQRIEVLRGPQGTLFGRNTVGGAVNIISKKPTGNFNLSQTVNVGNYDTIRSVTHLNLPSLAQLSTKFDYIKDTSQGWVNNESGGNNFTEYNNHGGRFSLRYNPADSVVIDYAWTNSRTETAQYYFQLHKDYTTGQSIGAEPRRQHKVRYPLVLEPTIIKKDGHSATAQWSVTENINFRSITGHHKLIQDTNNNYGGVLYFSGLIDGYVMDQKQFSQEFQLIGSTEQFEWIAGLYYFDEDAEQAFSTQISLTPSFVSMSPVTVDSFTGEIHATSKAVFGQVAWTPERLQKLQLTLGGRYTDDEKSGKRTRNPGEDFDFGSHSTDPMIALKYSFTDNISSYIKWSTAYKSVGYNLRSISFEPFRTEEVETTEIGLKSLFFDNRTRFNLAAFSTVFENMQLDFINPVIITNPETKNAIDDTRISGLEIDMAFIPAESLTIRASYTYLATDKQIQTNPLDTTLTQTFHVTQAPEHAGSLSVDHYLRLGSFGSLSSNLHITSTDTHAYVAFEPLRLDAYTLLNASFTLDIPLRNNSNLTVTAWGKNLLDEEYVTNGFAVGNPAQTITQVFGDPRTYGLSLSYRY